MIQKEIEKIAICPVCLESLTTDFYFTSDEYLYHEKSFSKLIFESPINRQGFSYYLPVNTLVNDKVFKLKNIKIIFRIIYNLDEFDQD